MSDDTQQQIKDAIAFAELKSKVDHIEDEYDQKLQSLGDKVKSLEKDRDSALRWGIVVLGTSVMSMAVWIFKLVAGKLSL